MKIDAINSTPANSNKTKRIAVQAGTGAVIGGGVTYYLQKRAIAKDIAAKEALANRNIFQKGLDLLTTGLSKVWKGIKNLGSKAKTSYKEGMENVVKTGKISKMGIAKGAAITAIALPIVLHIKNKKSEK